MNSRRFYIPIVSALLLTATVFIIGMGQEQSEMTLSKKNQSSSSEVATLKRQVKSLEINVKSLQDRVTSLEKLVGSMRAQNGPGFMH